MMGLTGVAGNNPRSDRIFATLERISLPTAINQSQNTHKCGLYGNYFLCKSPRSAPNRLKSTSISPKSVQFSFGDGTRGWVSTKAPCPSISQLFEEKMRNGWETTNPNTP